MKYSITNMIYAAMIWASFYSAIGFMSDLIKSQSVPVLNIVYTFMGLLMLTSLGMVAAIIPTMIGAMKLAAWLDNNRNIALETAPVRGTEIGLKAISFVTIPLSIIVIVGDTHGFSFFFSLRSLILFIVVNAPIMICAAFAGRRTGLQLAKFVKAENQLITSEQ